MSQPNQYGKGYPHPARPSPHPAYPAPIAPPVHQGFTSPNPQAHRPGVPVGLLIAEARRKAPDACAIALPPSPTTRFHPDLRAPHRPPLYRKGNGTSPQFDRIRVGDDIDVTAHGEVLPNTGGVSTDAVMGKDWKPKQTWVLPSSASLGDQLVARNDDGSHWLVSPARKMAVTEYQEHLAGLNLQANRYDRPIGSQSSPHAPAPAKAAKPKGNSNKAPRPGKGSESAGQSGSRG